MVLHQLHHRPEYEDIRSVYDHGKTYHFDHESELLYQKPTAGSDRSRRVQPATYPISFSRKPPGALYDDCDGDVQPLPRFFTDQPTQESPKSSVETYASTVQSEEDLAQDEEEIPDYDVPEYSQRPYAPRAIPATPSDFSELFPSHRRLVIRHDDSTLDGNMNLRLDTEVTLQSGRRCDMTLFHLRMHDLRDRDCSLRRYCRDSGREVCHFARKRQNPANPRPSLQRSLSNALNTMRSKSEQRSATMSSLKRNDSGYGSAHSSMNFDYDDRPVSEGGRAQARQPADPNSVKLEFSNYAQVEVRLAGAKASKRYEFEYWGTEYVWKRIVQKDELNPMIHYHLTKHGGEQVLAYITPSRLSPAEAREEQSKGGWVSPCSMWIADESIVRGQKDVADVVVASGLVALVDDAIRTRFHSKESQHFLIPKLQMGVETLGPKRLINEMFKRDGSRTPSRRSSTSRPSSSHRG